MKKLKWYSIYCYQNVKESHLRYLWCYVGRTQGRSKIRGHRGSCLLGEDLKEIPDNIISFVIWTGKCTSEEIDKKERQYIKEHGCVFPNGYNLNHGGGGVIEHTEETKQKICETRHNNGRPWHSKEAIERMRKVRLGKKLPSETIEKLRRILRISQNRPEVREKMSKAHVGKKHSIETREKLRKSRVGKNHSIETRKKISKAHVGKKHSIETREKMSKSQQERRRREKDSKD